MQTRKQSLGTKFLFSLKVSSLHRQGPLTFALTAMASLLKAHWPIRNVWQPITAINTACFQTIHHLQLSLKRIMSGRGKGKVEKAKHRTRSYRAGLQFPVAQVDKLLRKVTIRKRVGDGAPVYLTALLECLVYEVLELARREMEKKKKTQIRPCHLQRAIRRDEELNNLCSGVIIAQGGVLPDIQSLLALFLKKKGNKV